MLGEQNQKIFLTIDCKSVENPKFGLNKGGFMINSNEILETSERLKAYPELMEEVKEMLDLIEGGNVESADDFEEALIPEVRKFGKKIIETWATHEEKVMEKVLENKKATHHSKKNCTGKPPLEK